MRSKTDRIYAERSSKVAEFKFDDAVAEVFPDMIERSVPGYREVLKLVEGIGNGYLAHRLGRMHTGRVNAYAAYVLATLLIVLILQVLF
jgi:hypothetical protein